MAHLKWPNDLLVGPRKLAGLLAEGARIGTPDAAIAIGIGINLQPAAYPADVAGRATSVAAETGRTVGRGVMLAAIIERLADTLAAIEAGGRSDILRTWRLSSPLSVGTRVEWDEAAGKRSGITAGVDDSGALLVDTGCGLERVIAGEITWHLGTNT
jgi:BirA family biotin operon repressor/biotin-[acetyl-CoA-carboxylase] ligase